MEGPTSPQDLSKKKLFIGGLSPQTTKETMQSYFSAFGSIHDCTLMIDRGSGRSRCFGFITMSDSNSLENILSKDHIIDGKKVDCKIAVPKETANNNLTNSGTSCKTKKMFVGGLPQDVTDESFREFFQQYGEVEDSIVMLDRETGRPRGFGFVTFKSEDVPDKVLENYSKISINGKWVECKKATPKATNASLAGYPMAYMMYSQYPTQYSYTNEYYQPIQSTFNYNPEANFYPSVNYDESINNA